MVKINYFFKLTRAYISRFKAVIIIGIAIGLLIFSLLRYLMPLVYSRNVQKIGITGRFYVEDLPENILGKIGDGLTTVNEKGLVEGNMAASWVSKDGGRTWEFKLKDNLKWQDGKEVTASDIKYEFNDVETKVLDEKTVSFNLKDPFSPFPSVLTQPIFRKGLLGTGEWTVGELTFANSFVKELVLENKDNEKVIYRFYPTTEKTKTAFKLGQIDKIEEILDPKPFDNWKNLKVSVISNKNQVITLFFNTQDKYLSEKSLRQALTYAIKKDEGGERALSPISPLSWAYNPQVKSYDYDTNRFSEIMKDLPGEVKKDLNIKLTTSPSLLPLADKIAKNWNELGVPTTVQVTPVIPTDFQVFLTILDIPKDPDQYSLWHTSIPSNISKYSNLRIDKLLEDGRSELDFETRRKLYLDFQRFLLEDLPAAFLYHPVYYTVERK